MSYSAILEIFWQSHDPRRNFGGRQYRHAIWYHDENQKKRAMESRFAIAASLGIDEERIATAIEPIGTFTYAEDYHQKYSLRREGAVISELESLFHNHSIAFTDSTVMTRLNGIFGEGFDRKNSDVLKKEIEGFGLPGNTMATILKLLRL